MLRSQQAPIRKLGGHLPVLQFLEVCEQPDQQGDEQESAACTKLLLHDKDHKSGEPTEQERG
jgi:hypothetical protein